VGIGGRSVGSICRLQQPRKRLPQLRLQQHTPAHPPQPLQLARR
jgi:hypothetical protein